MISSISPSKLTPPKLNSNVLLREQLLNKIKTLPEHCKLVVLQAPAGYGKTTLMSQYQQIIDQQGHANGWLTLDESDNDLSHYLNSLAGLITKVVDIEDGFEEFQNQEYPVNWLDGMLKRSPKPSYYFIDEFELLDDPAVIEFLNRGFKIVPNDIKVIIACRGMPDFSLTKMLIAGEAVILNGDDLAFEESETEKFVDQKWPQQDNQAITKQLLSITEGWPAAMQLAYLAFGGAKINCESISKRMLNDSLIGDYVLENVLQTLSEEQAEFLLCTSCLKNISAPMCDFIFEQKDSHLLLKTMLEKGLFLHAKDQEMAWFGYHKLFAQLLTNKLQTTQPDKYRAVNKRASEWCANNGFLESAIWYALQAQEVDMAIALLEKELANLIFSARLNAVSQLLAQIPKDSIRHKPNILFGGFWASIMNRDFRTSKQFVESLKALPDEHASQLPVKHAAEISQLTYYLMTDDITSLERDLKAFLAKPGDVHPFYQLAISNLEGFRLILKENLNSAQQWMQRNQSIRQNANNQISELHFDSLYSFVQIGLGNLDKAFSYINNFESSFAQSNKNSLAKALLAPVKAFVLYEKNDIQQAIDILQAQSNHLSQYKSLEWLAVSYITLARCYLSQNDVQQASNLLDDLERLGYSEGWPRLVAIAKWEQVRNATLTGNYLMAEQIEHEINQDPALSSLNLGKFIMADTEHNHISKYRLALMHKSQDYLLDELDIDIELAQRESRHYRLLKLKLMKVTYLAKNQQAIAAQQLLESLLMDFVPNGFVRSFLDEGALIKKLLNDINLSNSSAKYFAGLLLGKQSKSINETPSLGQPTTRKQATQETLIEPLTHREQEILQLLVMGESNRSIANNLFVSEGTIKWHLGNIYGKLGVKKRTQAMMKAQSLNLVQ